MIGPIGSSGLFPLAGLTGTELENISAAARNDEVASRRRIARASLSLRSLLDQFRTQLGQKPGTRGFAAVARSGSDLGLTPVGTATTLTSTEEVNATPTSFSPFGPTFAGASTSEATITGVYDGIGGDDTLTFSVKREGTPGTSNYQIDVLDGSGSRIDRISSPASSPPGTEFTLSNGLVVSFSAGDLKKNDTFTVDVFSSVGSAVDPDKAFDGTRNDYANLEYGTTVSNGFFYVNGEVITVSASDTLNDVLARITGSAAGVTATFDAGTERVLLTQKSSGSSYDIVLSGDTSGFLAATKLDAASSIPGQDGTAEDAPLAQVAELASIASGTLTINGVDIGFDVNVDSLQDVLGRITTSGAGVSATLHANAQRVTISSDDRSAPLVLDDGGTGFFAALDIDEGTYEPTVGRQGVSTARLERTLRKISAELDDLFREADSPLGAKLTSDLVRTIQKTAGTKSSTIRTSFGVSFDSRDSARRFLEFTDGSGSRFRTAARQDFERVRDFFLKPSGTNDEALIDSLIERLETAEDEARASRPEGTGTFLDILA